MKTKIVYCLVSDSKDYYYEQLLISLCSLRKHNPDAEIEVVCDNYTFATLKDNRHTIYDYDIHVTAVETPEGWNNIERSRYLKTNLRKLTRGDYLFIDTDTIICSSLEFIDNFTFDIAAVCDSHLETPLPKRSKCKYRSQQWIWQEAKKKGVYIEGLWHYNSGVMFVRDTQKTHELYKKWAELYQSQIIYGVKIDQLPLLLANKEMNNLITPLNWNMNCQVPFDGIRDKVPRANIIHYFPYQQTTILSSPWIMDPLKETGKINITIQRIIDNPFTFFDKKSRIVVGDAVSLLDTPYLLTAYIYSHKAFHLFARILDLYIRIKRKLSRLLTNAT